MGSCQSMNHGNEVLHPLNFQGIQIICKSWKKTYSNLFDYNAPSNSLETQIHSLDKNTRIIKQGGTYSLIGPQDKYSKEIDALIDVIQNEKNRNDQKIFTLFGRNQKSRQQSWVVIKSLPSHRYVLREGDMLKIGKQKMRVKEIISRGEQEQEEEPIKTQFVIYQNLTRQGKGLSVPQAQLANYQCKFCLDVGEINNPLLAPCNCAGSSKYVHLKCTQQWLTKTINPRTVGAATVITWKPLICELCHKTLPFKVYLDGRRYFTVNIPKPQKPYLVLNPIYKQKESSKAKIYFLISFAQKRQMIIGRKKDSDIVVSDDSSVSRHHSKIIYQQDKKQKGEGKFLISDNDSKFGTLVLLKKQLTLRRQLSGISLQIGGDLLQIRCGGLSTNKDINFEDFLNKTLSDNSQDYEQEQQQQGNPNEVEAAENAQQDH